MALNNLEPKLENIRLLATLYGWREVSHDIPTMTVTFMKRAIKISVFYSNMTVSTCLEHPKRGKTQLFRKDVTMKLLEVLLMRPRAHTDKGFY